MRQPLLIYKLVTIAYFLCHTVTGASFDETRYIVRSFKVSSMADLEVVNKYGDVTVTPWEKDSIRFEISIKVFSNSLDRMDHLFEKVDINFSSTSNYVFAETIWDNSSFINNVAWDIRNMFGSEEKVEIDYRVFCPATVEMEIDNEFGNINLGDHKGETTIVLSHGNLRANDLDDVNLELKYGKLRVDNIKKLEIDAKFADIKIMSVDKMEASVVSSEMDLERVKSLICDTKHDDISIEYAGTCSIESSFSDIDIEVLERSLTANMRFGSISIERAKGKAVVNGSNTDVDIEYDNNFKAQYKVSLVNGKSFRIEAPYKATPVDNFSSEFQNYSGVIGQGSTEINGSSFQLKNSYIRIGMAD